MVVSSSEHLGQPMVSLNYWSLAVHLGSEFVGCLMEGYVAVRMGGCRDIRDAWLLGIFMAILGGSDLLEEQAGLITVAIIGIPVPGTLVGGYFGCRWGGPLRETQD